MAGQVLDELFVDVTARGLQAAQGQITAISDRFRDATAAHRAMRAEMEKAVNAQPTQRASAAASATAPQAQRAAANKAVGDTADKARDAEKQIGGFADKIKGMLGAVATGAAAVAAPLGALTAGIVGMARAGLEGTVQMEMLNNSYKQLAREVAAAVLPAVTMLNSALRSLTQWVRQTGLTGQQVFYILTAAIIGATVAATVLVAVVSLLALAVTAATGGINLLLAAAIGVVAAVGAGLMAGLVAGGAAALSLFSNLRAAFAGLGASLGRLWQAVQPLLTAFGQLAGILIQVFIVEPLVLFIELLTKAVDTVTQLVNAFMKLPLVMGVLGAINRAAGGTPGVGPRRQVALAQTTNYTDAGSAYQSLQEAGLRAGQKDTTPIEKNTSSLDRLTTAIETLASRLPKSPAELGSNVLDMARGGPLAAGNAIGNALPMFGKFLTGGK